MTIQEFELQLKQLDPKFEIVLHPNNPELSGVYYDRNIENKTGFLVTAPAGEIHQDFNPKYRDSTGHPHNWITKIEAVCKGHLKKLAENPQYKEMFYAPLKSKK